MPSNLSFTEYIRNMGPFLLLYALLRRVFVFFEQHHIPCAALVSMLVSLLDFSMKYLATFARFTSVDSILLAYTERMLGSC